MKHNPEEIYDETGKPADAWGLWMGFRLFLWAVLFWAVISAGYLLVSSAF